MRLRAKEAETRFDFACLGTEHALEKYVVRGRRCDAQPLLAVLLDPVTRSGANRSVDANFSRVVGRAWRVFTDPLPPEVRSLQLSRSV